MRPSRTTLDGSYHAGPEGAETREPAWALVVVWCVEGARLGEALLVDPRRRSAVSFGREWVDDGTMIALMRQRPGQDAPATPFDNPYLSRRHLELVADGDGVRIANVGKRPIFVNGRATTGELVRAGDVIEIKNLVAFLVVRRPSPFPPINAPFDRVPFGEADARGIVGESARAWELRDRVAFCAGRDVHVLVTGESGCGKELVAQAMHALSSRAQKRMVSRNAATLPHGIADAELFGNVANYPNPGMPERPGVVGEAHESTLFLDEIGELSHDLQAHLLRVLDEGGEYQRLGDARRRRADLRVVAATNRPVDELKHDLVSRLVLRLEVPSLNDRREDIPLVARHILRKMVARDTALAARFGAEPTLTSALARALVQHTYTTHVRELHSLLLRAMASSRGAQIDLSPEVEALVAAPPPARAREPREHTADEIRAALARHAGVRERVWRELELPSRHALHRLMKKYGIAGAEDE